MKSMAIQYDDFRSDFTKIANDNITSALRKSMSSNCLSESSGSKTRNRNPSHGRSGSLGSNREKIDQN